MASASGYHCSHCKVTLITKKDWIHHLLSAKHQVKVGETVLSWESPTKERVLVLFGKFSVATEPVLEAFCEADGRSPLSGFVWNEKRPRVGLVLFERREKVEEILNGLSEGSRMELKVLANNLILQLRKAADYIELEWEVFVQDFCSGVGAKPKIEPKRELDDEKLASESIRKDDKTGVIKVEPRGLIVPPNLDSQFDVIRLLTEIEAEVHSAALTLMENCERVLTTNFGGCRLFMFRDLYLKPGQRFANEVFFYLDAEGALDNINGGLVRSPPFLQDGFVKSFINSAAAQKLLPEVQSRTKWRNLEGFSCGGEPSMFCFFDSSTKLSFVIVTDPVFAIEAQTSRLLNYLLDFDPRARPLLTLIFYWADQNLVELSDSKYSYDRECGRGGLAWLVVFFLCRKGILPKPREILERTPGPLVLYPFYNHQINIGFRMDPQFAQDWRAPHEQGCKPVGSNEFVLQLVELSKEFFTFYGNLQSNSQDDWVLNTKDGDLMTQEDLRGDKKPHEFETPTRLSIEELEQVRGSIAGGNQNNINIRLNQLNGLDIWNRKLNILHPLNLQWKVACDENEFFSSICFKMLASAKSIENWVLNLDRNRGDGAKYLDSLQDLFRKVTAEEYLLLEEEYFRKKRRN